MAGELFWKVAFLKLKDIGSQRKNVAQKIRFSVHHVSLRDLS